MAAAVLGELTLDAAMRVVYKRVYKSIVQCLKVEEIKACQIVEYLVFSGGKGEKQEEFGLSA